MLPKLKSLFSSMPKHTYNGPTLPTALAASTSRASASGQSTAIFANGCYWGTQHMFDKTFGSSGLLHSEVGFIGGTTEAPSYRQVCGGATGHAEAVRLTFDPAKVSYAELTEFHFRMHLPTEVNRQGPDTGTQYRTAIFTTEPGQAEIAAKVRDEVQKAHYPGEKIATTIEEAGKWYTAEDYHQKYLEGNSGGYECPTHILYW